MTSQQVSATPSDGGGRPVTAAPLPRATPSELGIDAQRIRDFLKAAQAEGLDVHSLVVVRHGRVACEGYAAPYGPDDAQLVYSLSKTFTSATAGVAVSEGRFGYDDLLVDRLPDLATTVDGVGPGDKARRIRVRDALAMATGHTRDMYPGEEWLHRAHLRDLFVPGPDGVPGETFAYNQLAPYAVARIVEQTTGQPLLDAANQRVLHPLGITEAAWATDADGLAQGFSGLYLRTASIASFFQLLLDGGVRHGVRVLPEEWIEQHRLPQTATPPGNPDWERGYGWLVWMARHGYRGDGAFGQYGLVLPEQDAVIAMTGEQQDMQALLDLVWRHLLPAFDGPGDTSADETLVADLDAWWLDPVPGDALLGVRVDADDGLGGRVVITDDLLTWTDSDGVTNVAALGEDDWALTTWRWPHGELGVATSAARQDEAVVVRAQLTSTPHSFTWTCEPGAPTRFAWRHEPLHGTDPRALAVPLPALATDGKVR